MSESKSLAQSLPELDTAHEGDFDEGPSQRGPDDASELAFGGVPIPTPSQDIPERVRFATPAILSFDGYEETFDVAILNLSANGVACTGPQGLAVRDRLRLSFRLNLTSHPRSFLCEVIWVQATTHEEANYGLRFVDLDADLADHVLDTVRERVEGRASEWAMPILPGPSDEALRAEPRTVTEPVKRSRRHIWLAASAGMAAGIGLCLVIAAVTASMEPAPTPPPVAATATPQATPTMPLQPVTAPVPAPTSQADVRVAPPGETPPAPKAEAAPIQEEPASEPTSERTKPALVLSHPAGVQLEVHSGGRASLVLPLNGPPTQKEMFWLNNPTRLVVDVAGRQSALTRGVYDLDSPFVSRVRVGHHPGKVRFVIETGKSVATKATAQAQGNRLRLELQSAR